LFEVEHVGPVKPVGHEQLFGPVQKPPLTQEGSHVNIKLQMSPENPGWQLHIFGPVHMPN
jgi:hypothetical protein